MKDNELMISTGLVLIGLYIYFNQKKEGWTEWFKSSKTGEQILTTTLPKSVEYTTYVKTEENPELEKQPLTEPVSTVIETPHEATVIPEYNQEKKGYDKQGKLIKTIIDSAEYKKIKTTKKLNKGLNKGKIINVPEEIPVNDYDKLTEKPEIKNIIETGDIYDKLGNKVGFIENSKEVIIKKKGRTINEVN